MGRLGFCGPGTVYASCGPIGSYRLCSIGYTLYLRAVQLFSLFVWLTFPGRVHMTCTLSVRGFGRCATHRGVPTMKSRTFSAAAASTAHATASPKDDILQIRRLS